MKKEIGLKTHSYTFNNEMIFPEDANSSIFIPCWSVDFVHYYFLLDFEKRVTTVYELNLSDHIKELKEITSKCHKDDTSPNGMTFEQVISWVTSPHQGELYNNCFFISLNYSNFFICIDTELNKAYIIYDESDLQYKVYSSTNQTKNGKMYLSRWEIKNMYKDYMLSDSFINVEIVEYDIASNKFTIINTIDGKDRIHSTNISADDKYIILVEMNTRTKSLCSSIRDKNEEIRRKIYEDGLIDSHIFVYDIERKKTSNIKISGSPAHIVYDNAEDNILYISQNKLGVIGPDAYSFGPGSIIKYAITKEGTLDCLGKFQNEDTVRLPGHVIFKYLGKNLIVTPATPHQILLINCDDMELEKKISLRNDIKKMDFKDGPLLYSPMLLDKTPYSAQIKNGTSYLYLNNLTSAGIYDFMKDSYCCNFRYNLEMPVIGCGHSLLI